MLSRLDNASGLKHALAASAELPWAHIMSALGGLSFMYFWNYLRTPRYLTELCSLTRFLGPPRVLQWLNIEKGKKLAEGRPFDDYDMVVRLESVLDLNDRDAGCPILVNSKVDFFESRISVRTVAVLGLYNTGKSFLQSRLFGFNFPQGVLQRTAGLSMKMLDSSNLLIVDSAGNLEPVSTENWALEDAVRDRKDVELMVKELVIQLADILIVTVNDITWPEQEFCQTLMDRCVQKPRKCLIVLHNMQHIFDADVAKARFHEHVSQLYQGKQVKDIVGQEHVLEFVHRDEGTDLVVNHFGLGNQFSAAGLKYNEGAFKRIRAVIDFHDRIGSNRCIKDIFERQGTAQLPHFFYCDDDLATTKMKLEFESFKNGSRENYPKNCIGALFLRHPDDVVAHWRHRTNSTAPEYLDSTTKVDGFQPAFSISVETTRNGNEVLHIQIEAPGCNQEHLMVEDIGEGLLVTINKVRSTSDSSVTKLVEESRVYSSWKHLFEYKIPGSGVFEPPDNDKRGVYIHDGVAHILLPRARTRGSLNVKSQQAGFRDDEF